MHVKFHGLIHSKLFRCIETCATSHVHRIEAPSLDMDCEESYKGLAAMDVLELRRIDTCCRRPEMHAHDPELNCRCVNWL
jgi:hypothetical protein